MFTVIRPTDLDSSLSQCAVKPDVPQSLRGQVVGIVAGWGNYPIEVAKQVRSMGASVVTVGLRHHVSDQMIALSDHYCQLGVGKLGGHHRFFQKHKATKIVLAGKVFKDRILLTRWSWLGAVPDLKCVLTFVPHYISRQRDQRDDSLLHTIAKSYEAIGMEVVAGTRFAKHLLAEPGVLTTAKPSFSVRKDIEFGWSIAKAMGNLDIGQSVTICDQMVLAVEAIEGTDACIARTKELRKNRPFTLIKVAKPQQDERFDLPTIGPLTIEKLHHAGGHAIVIEEGRTILIDREETLSLANKLGITIVSLQDYNQTASYPLAAATGVC